MTFPNDRFTGNVTREGGVMKSTGEVVAGGKTPVKACARVLRAVGRGHGFYSHGGIGGRDFKRVKNVSLIGWMAFSADCLPNRRFVFPRKTPPPGLLIWR